MPDQAVKTGDYHEQIDAGVPLVFSMTEPTCSEGSSPFFRGSRPKNGDSALTWCGGPGVNLIRCFYASF